MSTPLFSIRQLTCSYNQVAADKVLFIDELNIPKGKLIFLLGASGSGKSTLLETLGLMNNPVASGKIELYPGDATTPIDLTGLWAVGNDNTLTQVRKKHYSFIFQNTNLMENFTAYENVCLSGMIKENVTQEETLARAKDLMKKVKLPENEVNLQTLAVNLSGGQRQRLAFVRALNTNASILFGDEPTGNLDEANANELFEVIKSNLTNGLSAIVVSHDINLAVKHADQIIVITKDFQKGYGEVLPQNIFYKEDIAKKSDEELIAFKKTIRSLYHTGNEQKIHVEQEAGTVDLKNSYRKLFFKKEGKVLLGKASINLIILSTILFFTFLAIGFANGSLDYLNKKMNSAFVQWLTITIPFKKADGGFVQKMQKELNQKDVISRFQYQNVTAYVQMPLYVWDTSHIHHGYFRANGRSVDLEQGGDQKLINEDVLGDKNLIRGRKRGFKNDKDLALIVTQRFLADYHYPANADFIYLYYTVKDTTNGGDKDVEMQVPIPIRAVVNELPGKYAFIYPMYFYKAWNNDRGSTFDIRNKNKDLYFFFKSNDKKEAADLHKAIKQAVESNKDFAAYAPEADAPNDDTIADAGGFRFSIGFYPQLPNSDVATDFSKKLLAADGLKKYAANLQRMYVYDVTDENFTSNSYDELSVYFKNLDKVREFSKYIYDTYNSKGEQGAIEVDVSKIKEKENFNFLSKVTSIISYLLVIFSTIAVCLFIFNLLKMHLMKVRMNIGTFKAIGLGNFEARNIYFFIIFLFIVASVVLSLILSLATGLVLDAVLTANLNVEQDVNYFKIIDWNTLLTVMIILVASLSVSWFTTNKILSKSPGDLIYNR